ncbi:MAG: hypothetical protein KC444_10395, partial [Nitrosopumilus sp.]|nr:hypothetical protein [Nitrosopumilus sp.]
IETFNSVDVRIFCILKDDFWNNIFTLIRFRREKVDELKKKHEEILQKCGELLQTEEFRVGMFQFPIEKWENIKTDLSKKFICLRDGFTVTYSRSINFNHVVHAPYFPDDKGFALRDWRCFHGHSEDNENRSFRYTDKLVDEAIKNHFSHINDYLGVIFEMGKYNFQRHTWIGIYAPVFLKIDNIDFSSDKVDISISSYNQQNLELAVNFFGNKARPKAEIIEKK